MLLIERNLEINPAIQPIHTFSASVGLQEPRQPTSLIRPNKGSTSVLW
jgi:hypothetical protein